jgi:pterin-4a-carbinolamine dehydratase
MSKVQIVETPSAAVEESKKLRHPSGEQGKRRRLSPEEVERLKAERVQEKLAALPAWRLTSDGNSVRRTWEFRDAYAAATYVGFVHALAGASGQWADITLSGRQVVVTLRGRTQTQGGLEQALDFAKDLG